ncbi:phage holin family protein [Arthrobacter sp. SLBN-53]|uniref:phage holin family protein n=1 Tax=Arthrobacter sp. SLBN-53 TaxID=2768412 RepID=UPI00114E2BA3|nr:phage holin family protein [Arthrobacter sp. SLBN-53]TQK30172.1 putative superfamily III holin-X [Arthrobacter sp. SLBN-53]
MTNVDTPPTHQASVPELITQLSEQLSRLVRDELRLAQWEFRRGATKAGIGAGLFSTAGLLAVSGWLALTAGAVSALALVLPVWAAAVIVAAVLFVAAAIAAMIGKKQLAQAPVAADEVVSSVSADVDAVRGR